MWNTNRFDTIEYQIEKYGIGHTWADSLNVSPLSELIFFTQYERDEDKFKPSRSGFVIGLYREAYIENDENIEKWNTYKLEGALAFMKKHHIKSVLYSGIQAEHIWEEQSSFLCFKDFVAEWISHYKYAIKDWYKLAKATRASRKLSKRLKEHYAILILRPDNWSPRLRLVVRRKNPYNEKRAIKEDKLISKFEDKYFSYVSVEQYDYDIGELTESEMEDDSNLYKRFRDIIKYHFDNKDDADEILYCNCNYILLDVDDIGVT